MDRDPQTPAPAAPPAPGAASGAASGAAPQAPVPPATPPAASPPAPTPQAPAQPATPIGPTEATIPPPSRHVSATEAASNRARQLLRERGTAIPRDEAGRFTDQPRGVLREPGQTIVLPSSAENAQPEATIAVGPDGVRGEAASRAQGDPAGEPQGDPAPAPAGEAPPDAPEGTAAPGEAPAAPGEAPAAPGAAEPASGEGDDDDGYVVELMPRDPNGEPVRLRVEDRETAERLRQTLNGAMRREQYEAERAQLVEREAQLAQREVEIAVDPVGFVFQTYGQDPHAVEEFALALLATPGVYERVAPRLQTWDDPMVYRADAAEIRERWRSSAQERFQTVQAVREVRENTVQIEGIVTTLAEQLDGVRAEQFIVDAFNDLRNYAEQHRLRTLPVEHLPVLLANRLRVYGLDPIQASVAVQDYLAAKGGPGRPAAPAANRSTRSTPGSRPAAPATKARAAQPSARSGREVRAAAEKKRAAAAIPSPGAGSLGSTAVQGPFRKPDGSPMTVTEAIAEHRRRLGRG